MAKTPQSAEIGTLESHIAKMRAAADKHLADRMSEAERQTWAEAKVNEYVRAGILGVSA